MTKEEHQRAIDENDKRRIEKTVDGKLNDILEGINELQSKLKSPKINPGMMIYKLKTPKQPDGIEPEEFDHIVVFKKDDVVIGRYAKDWLVITGIVEYGNYNIEEDVSDFEFWCKVEDHYNLMTLIFHPNRFYQKGQ